LWANKGYDTKGDMWSLGVLVYEISCLKLPFSANEIYDLMSQIIDGKYDSLPDYYSKELCMLVEVLLRKEPRKRPSCGIVDFLFFFV
jgi:NIMA (never in mitosis gene a)-related kinase